MSYLKIIDYRSGEIRLKRKDKGNKHRADKKHTVQALLSEREKQLLNIVMHRQGYSRITHFVNDAIANGLQLAITKDDMIAAKRYLRESEGIQVNGRLNTEQYEQFRLLQAKANLNQRQLTLVLIKKQCEVFGYQWR